MRSFRPFLFELELSAEVEWALTRRITTAEALVGLTYSLHDRCDLRAGYLFPVTTPRELDHGWLFGATVHF